MRRLLQAHIRVLASALVGAVACTLKAGQHAGSKPGAARPLGASLRDTGNGHVSLDGTLGRAGPVLRAQGDFAITPDLGRQVGPNLFHSFHRFDLSRTESATFSGADSVQRIMVRVTGGKASDIDGTLRSTIDGADLYLMNPAGILFGPNAKLETSGSVLLTTADVIRLSDGGAFAAQPTAKPVLTSAPPAAFGFVTPRPGKVTVRGAIDKNGFAQGGLAAPAGKGLTIVAGGIDILGSDLSASRLHLAALGGTGDVLLDPDDATASPDLSGVATRGDIHLSPLRLQPLFGPALLIATGDEARIGIACRDFFAEDAHLRVPASGDGFQPRIDSGGVSIDASGRVSLVRSTIDTTTSGTGDGGPIQIVATETHFEGARETLELRSGASTFAFAAAGSSLGTAGDITITSNKVTADGRVVLSASGVSTNTLSQTGPDGSVQVNAAEISVDGRPGELRLGPPAYGRLVPSLDSPIIGSVLLDGTAGPSGAVLPMGGVFTIGAELGSRSGGNLLHSFSEFAVPSGAIATFSGPPDVERIFARVTGGSEARINGTLRCEIANADLYLVSPGGILLGPQSSLDLNGAFVGSTASTVTLGEGGRIAVRNPALTQLTAGSPSSFAFDDPRAGIRLVGGELQAGPGSSVSLLGGDVVIDHGSIHVFSADINVFAVGSPSQPGAGVLPGDPAQPGWATALEPSDLRREFRRAGALRLGQASLSIDEPTRLPTDPPAARLGQASIAGGDLSMFQSMLEMKGGIRLTLLGRTDIAQSSLSTGLNFSPSGSDFNAIPRQLGISIRSGPRLAVVDGTMIETSGVFGAGDVTLESEKHIEISRSGIETDSFVVTGIVVIRSGIDVDLKRSFLVSGGVRGSGLVLVDTLFYREDRSAVVAALDVGSVGGAIYSEDRTQVNAPGSEALSKLRILSATLIPSQATLLPTCGTRLGGDISSFVVTGRGGIVPQTTGWSAELLWIPGTEASRHSTSGNCHESSTTTRKSVRDRHSFRRQRRRLNRCR